MFWKKKNKKDEKSLRIHQVPDDPRQAFRVVPDPEEPINLDVGGKSVTVTEISSNGLAFLNEGFSGNEVFKVKIFLPKIFTEISASLEILRVDSEGVCVCLLKDMDANAEDAIHHYVLLRQKDDLQSRNF